ncbi:MAG: hypothetical protein HLX50_17600 [Alteromonadaceae bacterium]|nr:hypothetical protein [Alteromonadaceae bacterium]
MNKITTATHGAFRTGLQFLLALSLTLFGVSGVQAQDLSEREVGNFVSSLEELNSVLAKHEDDIRNFEAGQNNPLEMDFSKMFSSGLSQAKGLPFYADMEKVATGHGFASLDEWAAVGDRVFQAVMALQMDQQAPAARSEMQASLAEIENSPHLTAAQKEQMRSMVESSVQMMDSASDVPERDKALVRPYKSQLETALE